MSNQTLHDINNPGQAAPEGLDNTFRHHYSQIDEQCKADLVEIKDAALALKKVLDKFPGSREMSLAKTKLEEAAMWAIKGRTG